jgi:hypothetical protein
MDQSEQKNLFTQSTPNSASLAEILLRLKDSNESTQLLNSELPQSTLQLSNSNPEVSNKNMFIFHLISIFSFVNIINLT